jgi:HlyD family secretion protein
MRKRLKSIAWLLLIAAVVVGGIYYYRKHKAGDEEAPVRTATVERQDIVVAVSAVGMLEPLTTVEVKASVAGEIVELAVDRGDHVEGGDLIARVDPTETQSAYDQAQADVASALARVQEATADLHRQREVTPAQIRAAEDAVETALVRVRQAESALEYQEKTTAADIRRTQESLAAAQVRVRQAEERAKAEPELNKAAIRQAEAEVNAAEEAVNRLKQATHPQEKAVAKSQIDAAKVNLENSTKALERLKRLSGKGFVADQQVEDAQTALAESQDRYDSAKAALDTLAQKHQADLREADARVAQAKAGLAAARTGEADVRVAEQELEAAEAAVRESQASLAAAEAGKTQDEVRRRDIEAARAAAEESRTQLRVAQANALQTEVTVHQVSQARAQARRSTAQLENARKNLAYTTIVAPRAGLVVDRFVEQGTVITSGRSSVTAGTNIVTLADVSRMFVLAEVDEADIGQVKVGLPAEMEVETFRDRTFTGRVTQVYPKGEEIENVTIFRVRIEVDEPHRKLNPGMTAEVSIIIDRKDNVLAAPNDALYQQRGQSFADVMVDGEPEPVEVETGIASFDWTEIKSGLREGEEVVVGGGGAWTGQGGPGGSGGPGGRSGQGGQRDGGQQMRRMMRMSPGGRR